MDPKEVRQDFVQGLRDLASWFEQHEEVRLPDWAGNVTIFVDGEGEKEQMATIARAMGNATKDFSDELASLRKNFSPLMQLVVHAYRTKICERVVVGTKTLPAEPEQVIPAKPEREEEIVEWRCGAILKGQEEEVEANAG